MHLGLSHLYIYYTKISTQCRYLIGIFYTFVAMGLYNTKTSTRNFPGIIQKVGDIRQRQKPQAPTPQAPVLDRQTRKFANAKVRIGLVRSSQVKLGLAKLGQVKLGQVKLGQVRLVLRLRTLAFATFLVWRLRIGARGFWRL